MYARNINNFRRGFLEYRKSAERLERMADAPEAMPRRVIG
jgi:hypothetical protein